MSENERAQPCANNITGFTCQVAPATHFGQAVGEKDMSDSNRGKNRQLIIDHSFGVRFCELLWIDSSDSETEWKHSTPQTPHGAHTENSESKCLQSFLLEHHETICIDPGKCGETCLVRLEVDT